MGKNTNNGLFETAGSAYLGPTTIVNLLEFFCALLLFSACGQTLAKPADTEQSPAPRNAPVFDSTQLQAFGKEQKISDSAAAMLQRFYRTRNYEYTWFKESGVAVYTHVFWNLHNDFIRTFADTSLTYRGIHQQLDDLLNNKSKLSRDKKLQAELLLTLHFFVYANNAYAGRGNPAAMEWHIPRKKLDAVSLLNSFIDRDGKQLAQWEPVNIFYSRLKTGLLHYNEIEKSGGWKSIAIHRLETFKPGDSSFVIKQVKQRLGFTLGRKIVDSTLFYDSELMSLIKLTQKSFGLKEDASINAALINELNVPVVARINQLLINLEPMRWLPYQHEGNFIAVNIPEFRLHVFNGEKKLFSIDIVVGQAAHSTVVFADKLQYVVFSPYWNLPSSIVRKEILPAMEKNGNYLSKNNMERTGYAGGLPAIRQKPGGANALGRVKFIFPNSYNIYFHDTPAKALFGEYARAFSHGCIRLAEPTKMATWLLRNQPEWTTKRMNDAMNGSKEKWVTLKEQVPVYITYFTAWVDGDGLLNFRKDIYSHDKEVAKDLVEQ
jgi:murein L,D-transpeptidase YcbB/YkuD